jgi:hypothetical protein
MKELGIRSIIYLQMSEIARIAKLKKIGICSLVLGGIFAIVSIVVPITMKSSIINGAKERAQLS